MRLPERIRSWRAHRGGYFWIPCPLCGEMFGGNEISRSPLSLPGTVHDGSWKVVCNQCAPNRPVKTMTTHCIGTTERACPWDSAANWVYGYTPEGWEGQIGEWLRCPGCIRVADAREYTTLRLSEPRPRR